MKSPRLPSRGVALWTAGIIRPDEISAHSHVRSFEGAEPPESRLFAGRVEELHAEAERFRDDLRHAGYKVDLKRHDGRSPIGVILAPGTVDALVVLAFEYWSRPARVSPSPGVWRLT